MLFKGFRLGMLLQLAVGPVAVFIFQTAVTGGFLVAESAVAGVAVGDGLMILLAIFGVGTLIERSPGAKTFMRYFGSAVLFLFGIVYLLGAFDLQLLPSLRVGVHSGNAFVYALVITLSNPLTIVFWMGVLSAKIAELNMGRRDMFVYGAGCVCATIAFLSLLSLAGQLTQSFLPDALMTALNVLVGVAMILFGLRNLRAKND